MSLSFDSVPVVDNHCHPFVTLGDTQDAGKWRAFFTEARDREMDRHVASLTSYRRVLQGLADFLGCAADETTVFQARQHRGSDQMMGALLSDANIDTLIIDRGFPPPEEVIPDSEVRAVADVRLESLLRLEPVMEQLIGETESLDEAKAAVAGRLGDVRAAGYVGLKSVAAYRCGLDIDVGEHAGAEESFRRARRAIETEGRYRLADKPLLDSLLRVAFEAAHEQGLPLQFHVGYGDSDVDMLKSNPLNLRRLLESHRYDGMKIVLLHECYPYTREGAYLASIYGNVYLDLSYGIPFLGFSEFLDFTQAAVAVAPTSKLVYSSDGLGMPELHWSSAIHGRRVMELVFSQSVARGELTEPQAFAAGEAILRSNSRRLYELN